MTRRLSLWLCGSALCIAGVSAQMPMKSPVLAPDPPPTAPSQTAPATPPNKPEDVAGIPVNYDESKVGTYTLMDPLVMANGTPVHDAKTWTAKRRPEIVKLFETQQYGIAPGRPAGESFDVFDGGTPALDGKAIRKQIVIYLNKQKTGRSINLVEYLPAKQAAAKKPVPMLLSINFGAVQMAVADPGIRPIQIWDPKSNTKIDVPKTARSFGKIDVTPLLDAGIGVATFYYGDVEPDYENGFSNSIRATYLKSEESRPGDAWGSIAAWAWGLSRVQDYFETDKGVDAKRVAIHGISRLGKTVMWAGAHDRRFAAVIASCSGEGGAALSHRDYGETVAHLTAPTRYPYQFAANYAKYGGFPDAAPMDANLLIALVAPRPLLLQTGNTDFWSDPKGEFLAAVSAGPVYKLLGKQDLGTDVWPDAKQFTGGDLAYYMHDGGHGMVPTDWAVYVGFLKQHLHPEM